MHSLQHSQSRHNIFSKANHDQNLAKQSQSPEKKSSSSMLPIPLSSPTTTAISSASLSPTFKNTETSVNSQSDSNLPKLDLNVRKKLAANDLAVKFSNKSQVLTAAHKLSREESNKFDVGDDNSTVDGSINQSSKVIPLKAKSFNKSKRNLKSMSNLHEISEEKSDDFGNEEDVIDSARAEVDDNSEVGSVTSDHSNQASNLKRGKSALKLTSYSQFDDSNVPGAIYVEEEGDEYYDEDVERRSFSGTDFRLMTDELEIEGITDKLHAKNYVSPLDAHRAFMQETKGKETIAEIKRLTSSRALPSQEIIEIAKKGQQTIKFKPSISKKGLSVRDLSKLDEAEDEEQQQQQANSNPVLSAISKPFMFLSSLTQSKANLNDDEDEGKVNAARSVADAEGEIGYKAPLEGTKDKLIPRHLSTANFMRFTTANKETHASTLLRGLNALAKEQGSSGTASYHVQGLDHIKGGEKKLLSKVDSFINMFTRQASPEKELPPEQTKPPEELTLEGLFGDQLIRAKVGRSPISDDVYEEILESQREARARLEVDVPRDLAAYAIRELDRDLTQKKKENSSRELDGVPRKGSSSSILSDSVASSAHNLPRLHSQQQMQSPQKRSSGNGAHSKSTSHLPLLNSPHGNSSLSSNYATNLKPKTQGSLSVLLGRQPGESSPMCGGSEDTLLDAARTSLPRQPLAEEHIHYEYQYSTNSYVQGDYINQTAHGLYERDASSRADDEEYLSVRHLKAVADSTTGRSEAVIYLPPDHKGLSASEEVKDNKTSPVQANQSSKIYKLSPEHDIVEGEEAAAGVVGGGSNKMLYPGTVVLQPNFDDVLKIVHHPRPQQNPHLSNYQQQRQRHLHSAEFSDALYEDEDDDIHEMMMTNDGKVHKMDKSRFKEQLRLNLKGTAIDDIDKMSDSGFSRASKDSLNPQRGQRMSLQSTAMAGGSGSSVDLRADILNFMKKSNALITKEYEEYVHATGKPKEQISVENRRESAGTNDSYSAGQSSLPHQISHLQKLYERLNNRYVDDPQGDDTMKGRIQSYIKDGIKENTRIMRQYNDEIDDWD